MTILKDHPAVVAAREADAEVVRLSKTNKKSAWLNAMAIAAGTQRALLAAIDAQPVADAEPVAWMSSRNIFYLSRHDAVLNGEQFVIALYAAPQPAPVAVPEGLTPRHWRVIDFALWRFIGGAYNRAEAATQDKAGRYFKPGAAAKFLNDAKDAQDARAITMVHVAMLAAQENTQ